MTALQAIQIGRKTTLKFAIWGILLSASIMTFLHASKGIYRAFEWIADFNFLLLFSISSLIFSSMLFGGIAGKLILKYRKPVITGIVLAYLVVWSGVFVSGLYLILSVDIQEISELSMSLFDYLLKPFYWISILGFPFIALLGTFCGNRIYKKIIACDEQGIV